MQENSENDKVEGLSDKVAGLNNEDAAINGSMAQREKFTIESARERMQSLREPISGKLPFETQCAIFAFAYDGVPNRIISRAFEVSKATVSHITGCLDVAPESYRYEYAPGQNADLEAPMKIPYDHNARRRPNRKKQYARVAREFDELGEEAFFKRYMTAKNTNKILRARRELIREMGRVPMDGWVDDGQ